MPYSMNTRPLLESERDRLKEKWRIDSDDLIVLVMLTAVCCGSGLLIGIFLEWLLSLFGMAFVSWYRYGVMAICGGAGLYFALSHISTVYFLGKSIRKDLKNGFVQEFHFTEMDEVYLQILSDGEEALIFMADEDAVLMLSGDALKEPETYGAPSSSQSESPYWNDLDLAHAFPASEFVVTRAPESDTLFSIEILGEPIEPESTDGPLPNAAPYLDFELFEGPCVDWEETVLRRWPLL
jgi:hypothetical protein